MSDNHSQIEKLVELILLHRNKYYAGSPLISDFEYDALEDQLKTLAPNHPVLNAVGSNVFGDNAKVAHNPPMLSLAKTYSFDEMQSWAKDRELVGTMKIDGVALSLVYENNRLVLAKTRGNGLIGEDVTAKVAWVKNCPHHLRKNSSPHVEIRGELFCSDSQFALLFEEMQKLGLETPSTPRNIVAGVLGRKQYFELARFFQFTPFDVILAAHTEVAKNNQAHSIQTELDKFTWLESQAFICPQVKLIKTHEETISYIESIKSSLDELDVNIDGIVFTYNDLSLHSLGSTAHHPRYKMSFKWQGQTAEAKIHTFKWMTSRLGIVTPVAVIDPIYLSGAQITNVTLHNASFVKLFNLKHGDTIKIIRSGEVIPKFLEVIKEAEGHYKFPTHCPSCQAQLIYDNVRLLCPNSNECPAQQLGNVLNWIAAAGIDDLSFKRLQAMFELGLVKHMSDLYKLTVEDLVKLPLTKEKMAKKLFENIQKSKTLSLANFLCGLGINGMGKTSWNEILEVFPSLEKVQAATSEEIMQIHGFAEKTAIQIVKGLQEKKHDITKLLKVGVEIQEHQKKKSDGGALKDKIFVITGSLSRPRELLQKDIEDAGAKVTSAVSSKVTAVITDDPNSSSSKAKKARDLKIPFWTEEQVMAAIFNKNSKS